MQNQLSGPSVSVVVPMYNSGASISACLNSLLEQSLAEIEVIVVDDGSSDIGTNIAEDFSQKHENFKFIRLGENRGTFYARLQGFKAAKGKYIGTVDSDDWAEPEMFQCLYKEAIETGSDVVECRLWEVSESGKRSFFHWSDHPFEQLEGGEIIQKVLSRKIWHIAANKIFHRRLLESTKEFLGGINDHIVVADDKLLTFPLFYQAKKYRSIGRRMYNYLNRLGSATNERSLDHDRRHISNTHRVDFYIRQYVLQLPIDEQGRLIGILDRNEQQELSLILKNISCHPSGSTNRKDLYVALNDAYGPRLLELMYGDLFRIGAGNSFETSGGGGMSRAIEHTSLATAYLSAHLKATHPLIARLSLPLIALLRLLYRVIKRLALVSRKLLWR